MWCVPGIMAIAQVERASVQAIGGREERCSSIERGEAAEETRHVRGRDEGQSRPGGHVAPFDG